jgi:hypothetical protein
MSSLAVLMCRVRVVVAPPAPAAAAAALVLAASPGVRAASLSTTEPLSDRTETRALPNRPPSENSVLAAAAATA